MYSPQTYVWGSSNNSRLGNASDPRYPISVRSRRGYIDTPAALNITNGGMTWSQNLQRDLVDACQSSSGTESAKASAQPKREQRVAVVEMVAGGWSFTVRDQDGAVFVWGRSAICALAESRGLMIDRSARWRSFRVRSSWLGRQALSNPRTDGIAVTMPSRIDIIRSDPSSYTGSG